MLSSGRILIEVAVLSVNVDGLLLGAEDITNQKVNGKVIWEYQQRPKYGMTREWKNMYFTDEEGNNVQINETDRFMTDTMAWSYSSSLQKLKTNEMRDNGSDRKSERYRDSFRRRQRILEAAPTVEEAMFASRDESSTAKEDVEKAKAEDVEKADETVTEYVEKAKIDMVISRVACNRRQAENALLSHNHDVDLAVSFLQGFYEDVTEQVGVEEPAFNLSISGDDEQPDDLLTDSSCPPVCKPLPSGRVWNDPDTRSEVPSSISIPFGLASQVDNSAGSSSVEAGLGELLVACAFGNLGFVKRILEDGGIDVNKHPMDDPDVSSASETPLTMACKKGHLQIVKELCSFKGTDVNKPNSNGSCGIHLAAFGGHLEIVKVLIQDFNVPVDMKENDENGRAALHISAKEGNVSLLRMLVRDCNADVEVKDIRGWTPLLDAVYIRAYGGKMDAITVLLDEFGANVEAKNDFGQNSIFGTESWDLPTAKLLISNLNDKYPSEHDFQQKLQEVHLVKYHIYGKKLPETLHNFIERHFGKTITEILSGDWSGIEKPKEDTSGPPPPTPPPRGKAKYHF